MSRSYGEKMVSKRVVTFTDCDQCGRSEQGEPEEWIGIDFGHNDWGNDSVESGDHWDACSGVCLVALLARIADDYQSDRATHRGPTLWIHLDSFGLSMARELANPRKDPE